MTTSKPVLKLDGPGELLETLPYLLGFRPEASLVLVGLDTNRVVVTTRFDLDGIDPTLIDNGVRILARAGAMAAIAVAYATADDPPAGTTRRTAALPHSTLINQVEAKLRSIDIAVLDSLFVQAGRWWSYPGRAGGCHDCLEGVVLLGDAATGPAAAVYAGLQAAPNRRALEAVLDPDPEDRREGLRSDIAAVREQLSAAGSERRLRESRSVKRALFAAAREGDRGLFAPPDDLPAAVLCRYAAGLREISVRDAIWLAIDQERLDGRSLWLQLLQRLPSPYDSAPLFLFGWATWRDGNGTLAAMAAERALRSDADYTAAELLFSAVQEGLDPFRTPRLRAPARRR